jgi:hypothetical protein
MHRRTGRWIEEGERRVDVGEGQYAVLAGRRVIPGPASLHVRRGQRCEVHDAHALETDEYLVVRVSGVVDTQAPCYPITADAAGARAVGPGEPLFGDGELIVICGLQAGQLYVPPSGVEVVPDGSADYADAVSVGDLLRVA